MFLYQSCKIWLLFIGANLFILSLTIAQVGGVGSTRIPTTKLDNLIQGRLYSPVYLPIQGSPYLTTSWVLGEMNLLDKKYYDLPLWYDIYADDLILLQRDQETFHFIRLSKEQIASFTLEDRKFVNIDYSELQDTSLKEGFYELAFDDKISLLIKRNIDVQVQSPEMISYFSRKDRYFLVNEGEVFRIRGKKSFLNIVGDTHKKQMLAFIKKQKIRFRKAGDLEWIPLVMYLNTLQSD